MIDDKGSDYRYKIGGTKEKKIDPEESETDEIYQIEYPQ